MPEQSDNRSVEAPKASFTEIIKRLSEAADKATKGEINGAQLAETQRQSAEELLGMGQVDRAFELVVLSGYTENTFGQREAAEALINASVELASALREMPDAVGEFKRTIGHAEQVVDGMKGAAKTMLESVEGMGSHARRMEQVAGGLDDTARKIEGAANIFYEAADRMSR